MTDTAESADDTCSSWELARRDSLMVDCEPRPISGRLSMAPFFIGIPNISVVLPVSISSSTGSTTVWYALYDLRLPVVIQIIKKFNLDYLTRAVYRRAYKRMLRNGELYIDSDKCFREWLRSRSIPHSSEQTSGMKQRACDGCAKDGLLCAKLVRRDNDIKLAIYPLVAPTRRDALGKSLSHWARE